jgi:hypothetical protein
MGGQIVDARRGGPRLTEAEKEPLEGGVVSPEWAPARGALRMVCVRRVRLADTEQARLDYLGYHWRR